MVIIHEGKPEIVNNKQDCLNLINPELKEAIEGFDIEEELNRDGGRDFQAEFKSYEMSNESYYSCLTDTLWELGLLEENIENAKRLNREDILKTVRHLIETINNEI